MYPYIRDLETSPLLLFGLLLLGGMASGELSRRLANLPRTTGYVLFGVLMGNSGLEWVDPYILGSAQFFIYPAIGLILFELGHRFPLTAHGLDRKLILLSLAETGTVFVLVTSVMCLFGFGLAAGLFAAAIAVSTSPAITIATSSDVGAEGPLTSRLFGLVALNGCVAFAAISIVLPMLAASGATEAGPGFIDALIHIGISLCLGTGLSFMACRGAGWLGRQAEHQHLMLLGLIVIGTGLPLSLEISPLLTLLTFGIGTRIADRRNAVVAIRIASDARVFLVVTFVLAGAALEMGLLLEYWPAALAFVLVRFGARWVALHVTGRHLGLASKDALFTAVGLLPMSSVALVLLGEAGPLDGGAGPALSGTLMGAIVLMQLVGPVCTQSAVRGFGEARRYMARRTGPSRRALTR
ncbi:cation:proton antiporter [Zoogloea sp.]|uniref:cation:proton antiporter n=1 Tax=Zoogloea sp. TaxID=49181 RepID=UPI00262EE90A|nr:cation:proton antiporter [Zoogloea sp.]